MKKPEEQLTFADLNLPKTRGRPRKPEGQKLTPAERAKRYRDKKRKAGVKLVPMTKSEGLKAASAVEAVYDLDALAARIAGKFE